MPSSNLIYIVVDCYPIVGTDAFRKFTGAAVGCWMRTDVCRDGADADALVKMKLSAVGWTVDRTLFREEVSSETDLSKSEGLEFFEQARLDGFVANLHVCARKSVGESDLDDEAVVEALVGLVAQIGRNGGVSLFSGPEGQWANGVTAGDEFVPLWVSEDDALGWLPGWPGYVLRKLTPEDLRASGFLERIAAAEMWLALGVGKSLLTMCHPAWVREVVGNDPNAVDEEVEAVE